MNTDIKLGTLPTWALFTGGIALYLGERVAGAGVARVTFDIVGTALVLSSLAARIVLLLKADAEKKQAERKLLFTTLVVVFSLFLYGLSTDEFLSLFGLDSGTDTGVILSRIWLVVFVLGALPLLFLEVAYRPMRRAPGLEKSRLSQAVAGGVSLAAAAAFLFTVDYLATEHDYQLDYSYFRTASPSSATLGMVKRLEGNLKIHLFFPRANEVLEQVKTYLEPIEAANQRIQVKVHDRFLEPDLAKKLTVRKEGTMVLESGERHEKLYIGDNIKKARRILRQLDRRFAEKFTKATSPIKKAYRTVGHMEAGSGAEGTQTIRGIEQILEVTGYRLKTLGIKEGLGGSIPGDCSMLLILGPRHPFLPEEVESIMAYVRKGGRLLIALDPGYDAGLSKVLKYLGIKFDNDLLVNDRVHLRRYHTDADKALLATVSYSSHPSVDTLHKARRLPVFLLNAGSLTKINNPRSDLEIRFPLRSLSGTFKDKNRNFKLDGKLDEIRGAQNLMAAVKKRDNQEKKTTEKTKAGQEKESHGFRALIFSDSDALTDQVLGNLGNLYLASDSIRWLAGIQGVTGAVESGEDIPIEHTRQDDMIWFYGMVFLVPALVLALGLIYSGRRRKGVQP
ncbi:MAG: hypothetical protein GXP49_18305 [Deltaproteobacteria bacterium]|nr:hypothetical protein [Deltaproteobacteria bacterium]